VPLTDGRLGVVDLVVCGRTIKKIWADGKVRVVARPPGKVGHWVRAALAPRGDAFFAQWSAECEIPVAYFIAGGKMRPYGGRTVESVALGWLPGGDAVVHFSKAGCGSGHRQPGIYAVPRTGKPRLLLRTPKFERYWMWGG
jgi:hypothetical protein